jgi:hypothetical protein
MPRTCAGGAISWAGQWFRHASSNPGDVDLKQRVGSGGTHALVESFLRWKRWKFAHGNNSLRDCGDYLPCQMSITVGRRRFHQSEGVNLLILSRLVFCYTLIL